MPGLLDRFKNANRGFNSILGGFVRPNNMGGLLSAPEADEAAQQARMALATSLLQAGGPSATPTSFGSNLGASLQQAQAVQQQAGNQALQQQMFPLQRMLMQSQIASNLAPPERELGTITLERDGQQRTFRKDAQDVDRLLGEGWTEVKAPTTKIDINQDGLPFKVPSGYMLADENDPAKGVVPIPGGPETRQSPEQAAKTAQLEVATDSLSKAYEILAPGGQPDKAAISTMRANVPFTEGRKARVFLRDAIEARIRAESGAAVPESEIVRAMERLAPSPLDDDSTVQAKQQVFQDFLGAALENIDPANERSPSEVVDDLITRLETVTMPQTPEGMPDFSTMSDEDLQRLIDGD